MKKTMMRVQPIMDISAVGAILAVIFALLPIY